MHLYRPNDDHRYEAPHFIQYRDEIYFTIKNIIHAHEKRTAVPSIKTNWRDQIFQNEIRRFIFTGPGLFASSGSKSRSKLSVSITRFQ